ncbi:MAG TPA: thiolase family protein [Solirubrobacterales bacterium]|nr:thiolase family protein [Solirubrobacterales bacterium]
MFAGSSNRVGIVASAQTQFKRAWADRQHVDLIGEVVNAALKGSGLRIEDVDFVIDSGSDILDGRSISNCGFLGAMGAHQKEESRVEEDGLWSALYGATKIGAGSAEVGLLVAYSKPSESDVAAFYWSQCEPFYQRPVGFGQAAASGLQAQSYLAEHGLSEEIFADVAAAEWAKAVANPALEIGDAPSAAEVRESGNAAAPLRELEMSQPVDGAVAVVIASQRVAERICPDPVWITGIGTAMDQHAFSRRQRSALPAAAVAAEGAYKRAGIDGPQGLSLAEVSASSSATQLMVLEALGLAEAGKGAALYEDGSKVAINPSGGALPADPIMATGLARLSEAALQLTGRVGHAPEGASSAVVHGAGGVGMQNHCVFTLEV